MRLRDRNERECELNLLPFANDTPLVADSEENLKRLVQEFGRVCKRRILNVNVGKSKVMACSTSGAAGIIEVLLDGSELEVVDCFRYLEAQVAARGGVCEDVNSRVNEAAKVQGAMRCMWKVRSVGMSAKRRMYESIVVPTALYGSETWAPNARERRRRLDVMEMRSLSSTYVWCDSVGPGEK